MNINNMLDNLADYDFDVTAARQHVEWKGLGELPVEINFTMKKRAGSAHYENYKPTVIKLSSLLWEIEGEKEKWDAVHNIFIHELAHFLTEDTIHRNENGSKLIHGDEWRCWCRVLGIEPTRTHNYSVFRESTEHKIKVVAQCIGCKTRWKRKRTMSKEWINPTCPYCKSSVRVFK